MGQHRTKENDCKLHLTWEKTTCWKLLLIMGLLEKNDVQKPPKEVELGRVGASTLIKIFKWEYLEVKSGFHLL